MSRALLAKSSHTWRLLVIAVWRFAPDAPVSSSWLSLRSILREGEKGSDMGSDKAAGTKFVVVFGSPLSDLGAQ